MTNLSSFKLENIGHTCYFAVGIWLSNVCHGFSKLYEKGKSCENQGRRWEKMAA